jgi:DNA-binding transcriptional LysR family regulator
LEYLRHLRYFFAVAEHMSFARAAQQLHISGPPLSRRIHQLEEELGARLFVRDRRRRVTLTDAGRLLLKGAGELVEQAGGIAEAARRAHEGRTGVVRIGVDVGLASRISRVLARHRKSFPGVELHVLEMLSKRQTDALREQAIDVAFVYLFRPCEDRRIQSALLFEDPLMICISREYALARRHPRRLRLKDVVHVPILIMSQEFVGELCDRVLDMYQRAGLTPRILPDQTVAQYPIRVAAGEGLFIGPKAISKSDDQVLSVPVDEPDSKIRVCVAWRRDEESLAIRTFLETVQQFYPSPELRLKLARK